MVLILGDIVRVVGTEGALGAGGGWNCSSSMGGSNKIIRLYPGCGSVHYFWRISIFAGAFEQERARKKGGGAGGEVFQEV